MVARIHKPSTSPKNNKPKIAIRITKKEILAELRKLGKTSAEVAKALARRKIKGETCEPDSCPIAHYLMKTFKKKKIESVSANPDKLDLSYNNHNGFVDIKTPRPVSKFIEEFDVGQHPKLDSSKD